MDTKFLKTFVTVVDSGSMAAAARKLNITPTAVAQQIRSLEAQVEVSLIMRAGRTVAVTESGSRILERARNLLRDVVEIHSVANDDSMGGELRIGSSSTQLIGILPNILGRMVKICPEINIFIQQGMSIDLHRMVEKGQLDAAFVLEAPFQLHKKCSWQLIREERLIVLAPRSMAKCDPHHLLATQPLIRYDRNLWGGKMAEHYLAKAKITPKERCEVGVVNAIAVMVDRGLGVSLIPEWARPWPEDIDVVAIPLPLESEPRRLGLVWSRSSIRIRLLQQLVDEVKKSIK